MFSKRLFLLGVLCLYASLAVSQEATKAEPHHYVVAFENAYVTVVSIHYGPHESSGMHTHPPGVVVDLTNGDMKTTDGEGHVRTLRSKAGEARWFPAVKHKVENMSDAPFDGVYIYVKATPPGASQAAARQSEEIKAILSMAAKH